MLYPYFAAIRRPASCVSVVSGTGDGQNVRMAVSASLTSSHDIPSFLRETDASSFSTCTLMAPPAASRASAVSVRASFWPTTYTSTFVSKNALALIGFFAAEAKARRQGTTQPTKPRQCLLLASVARYLEFAFACDSDFDLIALLQIKRLYNGRGKPNRQAVTPLRDLHCCLPRYTVPIVYHTHQSGKSRDRDPVLASRGVALDRRSRRRTSATWIARDRV